MPKLPKYSESDLLLAVQAIANEVSQKEAARRYGVPRSTLIGRIRDSGSRKDAHTMQMSLSPDLEASLSSWCSVQDVLAGPPTQNQVRLVAQRMLRLAGSDTELGKTWIQGFLRRNPTVNAKRGARLEKARVEAVTPSKIKAFFDILADPVISSIRPQNRWIMDETGIMDGQDRPMKVVGRVETKVSQVKTQSRSD